MFSTNPNRVIPQMKIQDTDKVSRIAQIKGTVRPGYFNPNELPNPDYKNLTKTFK